MNILAVLVLPMILASGTGEYRCHSEEFTKAKQKLDALVLNTAQKQAIATYEDSFRKQWSHTHSAKGCSHHEAHAAEFVAAAAGVLTDDQFVKFRGRNRTESEKLHNDVWSTGLYIDNLLKLTRSL